jgi:uncharacterized damage-inducible protein DinB
MSAFPEPSSDERETLLAFLGFLRDAVIRKAEGITDDQARWQPEGDTLISLVGIVNHLTRVEWRWIDGGFFGAETARDEAEFGPTDVPIANAINAYRERAEATDAAVREIALDAPFPREPRANLRWVLVHLINETARHAGHADAVRELLDGTTGE